MLDVSRSASSLIWLFAKMLGRLCVNITNGDSLLDILSVYALLVRRPADTT